MEKEKLAVYAHREEIIAKIKKNQVTVVEAPTGSGKTTQLPQIIYNAGLHHSKVIGVTQPRRIAAYSVCQRITSEMNAAAEDTVGYKMRFQDTTTPGTKVKIMTDGILLQEIKNDPFLKNYSIILIDEAHERSLNIDFILGLLKKIAGERSDFKIVISSATINARLFASFFNNAPIVSIQTQPYPVQIVYDALPPQSDEDFILAKIIKIIAELEEKNKPGDILVFLPGERSIKNCAREVESLGLKTGNRFAVLPVYSRLSAEQQNRVFNNYPGQRKIVIATNIAETSITIDGIVYVIDPGIAKINYYNPRTYSSRLETKPISRASIKQRRGRAGRTAPGTVFRLYSQKDFKSRPEYTSEEIYRCDLTEVVLRMADLGINDFASFAFITPPNPGSLRSAVETLQLIEALDREGRLTAKGKTMAEFPLEPRLARILLEALIRYPQAMTMVLIVISFLSAKSPFLYPPEEEAESKKKHKHLRVKEGDFPTWIKVFQLYTKQTNREAFCENYYLDKRSMDEIVNVHNQLSDMVKERNYPCGSQGNINMVLVCAAAGLKQYICRKAGYNSYRSLTEKGIRLHPGSFITPQKPDWIIAGEIFITGRIYARTGAAVPEKLIRSEQPRVYKKLTSRQHQKQNKRFPHSADDQSKPATIYILDKFFKVKKTRQGLTAEMPYHILIQLQNKKDKIEPRRYKGVYGKLIYQHKTITVDTVTNILHYFDKIDLTDGIIKRWPVNRKFFYPEDWDQIYRHLHILLKPVQLKKKTRRSAFLSLCSGNNDSYYFRGYKDFFQAVEESIYALQSLLTAATPVWNKKEKKKMKTLLNHLMQLTGT